MNKSTQATLGMLSGASALAMLHQGNLLLAGILAVTAILNVVSAAKKN